MACAALFPVLSKALARVDAADAALLGAIYVYHDAVFSLDKYAYNGYHPYTSWLPILVYILLRNLTPALRARYVHLFTFLGQVTLETYILQFHVWMKTTGLNGSPKFLLVLIEGHFWLNFAVVSAASRRSPPPATGCERRCPRRSPPRRRWGSEIMRRLRWGSTDYDPMIV